jgi:pimeloyl-ACP methyl ester carboxylesterase
MPTNVHHVANTDNPGRSGDIVFVHGLNGHWRDSWSTDGPDGFWPRWLAERFPHVGVWSAEYDAAAFAWTGYAMPIIDRATNLLDFLLNREIGDRPVVFVTHSMGGLVVKQVLRLAHDQQAFNPGYQRLIQAVRGVVFLATPHTGSDLAALTRYLTFFTRVTNAATDLQPNAAPLRDLNLWYRSTSYQLGIRSSVFFETRPTFFFETPLRAGVQVVDQGTADPGILGVVPVGIDADHITIIKPASREAQVFLSTARFLRELLTPSGAAPSGAGPGLPP